MQLDTIATNSSGGMLVKSPTPAWKLSEQILQANGEIAQEHWLPLNGSKWSGASWQLPPAAVGPGVKVATVVAGR